jgi:hypothetical protein
MSNNNKEEFDILKVVELARYKKYEMASVGFAILDKIDKIAAIPKKMKARKVAVQALYVLSEGLVKFDYFTPEQRRKLMQEAKMSDTPFHGPKGLFVSSAPVTKEELEEEYIPDEEEIKSSSAYQEEDYDEDEDYEEDYEDEEDSYEEEEEN